MSDPLARTNLATLRARRLICQQIEATLERNDLTPGEKAVNVRDLAAAHGSLWLLVGPREDEGHIVEQEEQNAEIQG